MHTCRCSKSYPEEAVPSGLREVAHQGAIFSLLYLEILLTTILSVLKFSVQRKHKNFVLQNMITMEIITKDFVLLVLP